MPNPGKPTEQKRKLGNPGKRPLPAPVIELRPANAADLVPPAHLEDAGLFVWAKCWHSGLGWLSPDSDLALVIRCCELADMTDKARQRYMVTGESADAGAFQKLNKDYLHCLSVMGFTPVDRGKMGLAEVKAISKLEQLRASR